MPLAAGTHIGPYEVVELLGAGGMGEVYRARDRKLNRDVALKVLLDSGGAGHERIARFSREAQTLAALNHPHIAQVYSIEEDAAAGPSIAMELVPGRTLAELMASGPLPINEALHIARQMADALEAAHEAGLVHRDLKPANVKVRDDGTVKVLDFGLAKTATAAAPAATVDPASSPTIAPLAAATQLTPGSGGQALTQAGVIMGTPAYMSPEQAKGRPIDKRADIWAYGAILFEMITGKGAFHAEDISETLAAVLTRQIDLAELPPSTPLRLRALIRRCLTRDPKQRLRDIGDARLVIDDILAGLPEQEPAPAAAAVAPSWQGRLPWAIAAAAIIAAAVMGFRNAGSPTTDAPRVITRSATPLTNIAGFVALSPDGSTLAYTSSGGPKGFYIAARPLARLDPQPVPGTDDGRFPVFSPDGQSIAFTLGSGGIRRVSITGGDVLDVSEGDFSNGAAWGGDNVIVFSGKSGLMRVSANGGTPQAITTLGDGEIAHVEPQFLPGGRILFTVRKNGPTPAQFAIVEGNTHRVLANGGDSGKFVPSRLTANIGHLTYGRDETLFAIPFDVDRLTTTGTETPVIERVSSLGPFWTADYAVSDDGLLVYARANRDDDQVLSWIDRNGAVTTIQSPATLVSPRLSPDDASITGLLPTEGRRDIAVRDLRRGVITRLTSSNENRSPVWTRDGLRIVFGATADQAHGVFITNADGSTAPRAVFATRTAASPLTLTPDGQTLIYNEGGRLLVRAIDGTGDARPLNEAPQGREGQAHLSPDGKWIAYTSDETGRFEAYVHAFPGPGRRERVSTNGAAFVRWGEGGKEILFWSTGNSGNFAVTSVSVRTAPSLQLGDPRELFSMSGATIQDVTTNGERLLAWTVRGGTPSTFVLVTNWFQELRQEAPLPSR